MQELDTLRLYVRNVLRNIKKEQKKELQKEMNEERSIRRTIRKLLREKQDTTQHNSTGINALEKLLNSIVPILETGYKDLKTDEAQRKSFQAHILRAIQNLLSTASVYFSADKKASGARASAAAGASPILQQPAQDGLKEEDTQPESNTPEKNPQFIDINKDKKAKVEKPNPINAFQAVEGEDLTGRNFALETFKKIQKQILETYSLLSNEQDREIFYDYLITNTRLYFDKFEDELKTTPAEPTTPEYEAEKAKKNAATQGGGIGTGGEINPPPESGVATPDTAAGQPESPEQEPVA